MAPNESTLKLVQKTFPPPPPSRFFPAGLHSRMAPYSHASSLPKIQEVYMKRSVPSCFLLFFFFHLLFPRIFSAFRCPCRWVSSFFRGQCYLIVPLRSGDNAPHSFLVRKVDRPRLSSAHEEKPHPLVYALEDDCGLLPYLSPSASLLKRKSIIRF